MPKWEITDAWLEELAQKFRATTPGPWTSFVEGRDVDSGSSFIQTGGEDIYLQGATDADQDFIAAARQALPLLIDEVRRLRATKT